MPKKEQVKKPKKDKAKVKNKNKNKNTVIVNVNSHNKKKTTTQKREDKQIPQPMPMPYVINAPSVPQSQPIIIQQPAQPTYLHYQNPNPVHLASQSGVNTSVPQNVFQTPRRLPARIPASNAMETQTELTGIGLNENLEDMNRHISNLREEKDAMKLIADRLFLQLNKEREENQLLDKEYQQRLRQEEESKHLLKEELFATQMEKNRLKIFIDDEERSRGQLIEGKRRQKSPTPDIRNYATTNVPIQPSLASAFEPTEPIQPIQPKPRQMTMDKYITPPQNQPSNFLDQTATQPLALQKAPVQPIEERDEGISPATPSNKLQPEERLELIYSLLLNGNFLKYLKSSRGRVMQVIPLDNGNFELTKNGKKVDESDLIIFGNKYLTNVKPVKI